MNKTSLEQRIYDTPLFWEVCKVVGYVGFPFRELAVRMKPLVDQHGLRKVSRALIELVDHTG